MLDLDFGRVGVQICYDVEYPEGWRRLAEKGAELVLYPTQSPQLTRPGMYAATHEYWVVSATFRNNASFFEPGTGLVAAQITEPKQTLVHEIDLSYLILPWSSRLRNGEAFREAFGDRVGYRYSESEDRGDLLVQRPGPCPSARWPDPWACSKRRPSSRLAPATRRIGSEAAPHADHCPPLMAGN